MHFGRMFVQDIDDKSRVEGDVKCFWNVFKQLLLFCFSAIFGPMFSHPDQMSVTYCHM